MKRSDRLARINAINNGIKSMAGATLAQVENEYRTQLHQLEQLKIYKEEYSEQLRQRMQGNVTTDEMQDYRYFFSSLYKAIGQQEDHVRHLKQQVENSRQDWLASDREVRKLDNATDHLRRAEAQRARRLEQKSSDEASLQGYARASMAAKH